MFDKNSVATLQGTAVLDTSGEKIGKVAQVYLDDTTGQPEWVTVRTGLFGTKESFVPLAAARLDNGGLVVDASKDKVSDAPRIDEDGHLSEAQEDELYSYYGVATSGRTVSSGYAPTGADGRTERGPVGRDTSGPTTDEAMTRSEEQLRAGTERVEAGRVRLRKYVVTDTEQVEVPVSREQVRLEREPITEANRDAAYSGPAISEEEHEVTLHEERPRVETEAVPVERVRLGTEQVSGTETVSAEVRKERVDVEDDSGTLRDRDR